MYMQLVLQLLANLQQAEYANGGDSTSIMMPLVPGNINIDENSSSSPGQ
jgi:hypothetical protein